MINQQKLPGRFKNSFALIDAEGCLVDWDEGFQQEWALVGHLVKKGVSFDYLLRAAFKEQAAITVLEANFHSSDVEALLTERARSIASERSREYRNAIGRIIVVNEYPTIGGGLRRLARDVTEERQSEQALREARQLLRGGDFNATGVFVEMRRNPDGSYVFPPVDQGLLRLLGLPPEAEGADPMFVHTLIRQTEKERRKTAAILEESARTLSIGSFDFRITDGLGRLRWLKESVMPRREPDGTVIFTGVIRDITPQKETEEQVELLRLVVTRSSDSVIVFESDGRPGGTTRILYVNARFEELFGIPGAGIVGQSAQILQQDELSRASSALLAAALRRADRKPIEFEAHGKGGRLMWIEARAEIVHKFDEGAYRWVVISRDITERRQAREELLRAKNAAEAGNRAKSVFLANMSHELRTPLNAIIGFTELIQQGIARNGWSDAYLEYLGDVTESGRHLLDLINSVLDLSKIEAGSVTLDPAPVDLRELVHTSLNVVSGLARNAGLTLVYDAPAQYPAIEGDFVKLKQILLNVLANAIKFTPPGGTVTATLGLEPDRAAVIIADTGYGIPKADLERVKLPFVQAETTLSRKFPGSGLGLSIAHQLCRLHGGSLDIESAEGKGTRVLISLPR